MLMNSVNNVNVLSFGMKTRIIPKKAFVFEKGTDLFDQRNFFKNAFSQDSTNKAVLFESHGNLPGRILVVDQKDSLVSSSNSYMIKCAGKKHISPLGISVNNGEGPTRGIIDFRWQARTAMEGENSNWKEVNKKLQAYHRNKAKKRA
jgi:hypothetical protein